MQLVAQTKGHDDVVENHEAKKIPFSDVVVKRKNRAYWWRKWRTWDLAISIGLMVHVHVMCLVYATSTFSWDVFWVGTILGAFISLFGISISYHRNLAHRAFILQKWLEYLFAYCGILAFQRGRLKNVKDLEKQLFYRFLRKTNFIHPFLVGIPLFWWGGFPMVVYGLYVRTVVTLHFTFLINSACHIWGYQAWDTGDLSKNNWLMGVIGWGEGWHNNHHAFEFSARHGHEWWQLDVGWYVITFLELVGLATHVKVPSETQKKRMALNKEDCD